MKLASVNVSVRTSRRLVIGVIVSAMTLTMPVRAQDVLGSTGVSGAGSTFVYPILSRWSRDYRTSSARGSEFAIPNSGLEDPPATSALEYEPVGSLAGVLRVKDRRVDFGASDMPLRSDELTASGLGQFPIIIGGIVVATNIEGVGPGTLRLSGSLLAEIFLGRITSWSDPAIATLNPGLKLPAAAIAVIHRSDGSGTTFNFTDYLSKVSPEWRSKVGSGLLVPWPTGSAAGGNEALAREIRRVRNSIGYVEYAQATQLGLSDALLQNRAGRFVRPQPSTFQAAAAGANWRPETDFYLLLTDVPAEQAYPVTATVFILMHKSSSRARTTAALDFFRWSLASGASTASQLGYVPLPASLSEQVRKYWGTAFR
jgi:phosphate transport system substrate-binding protein